MILQIPVFVRPRDPVAGLKLMFSKGAARPIPYGTSGDGKGILSVEGPGT